MKLIKLLGIIALVAVIGFSMAACGDSGGGGGGGGGGTENIGGSNKTADVLSAPTNVTASRNPTGSNIVKVAWNEVSEAISYKVYYSLTGSDSGLLDGTSYTTSYTSTDNSINSTWYFRVTTVNRSDVESSPSPWVSVDLVSAGVVDEGTIPSAPTGVKAVPVDQTSDSILVTRNPVPNAVSYNIYYANSSEIVLARPRDATTVSNKFTHTGLSARKTYYYAITAVNSKGESPKSSIVSATTNPPPPGGTTVSKGTITGQNITFSWRAVAGAKEYMTQWTFNGGSTWTPVLIVTGTSYTLATGGRRGNYDFRVRAINDGGIGPWSAAYRVSY